MKIRKSIFCCFCTSEILGIAVLFFSWKAGIAIISAGIVLLLASIIKKDRQMADTKKCPQCKAVNPLKARICAECGYAYAAETKEEELMEIIEEEREEVDKMTSEQIDCNFEKIEEIIVDEVRVCDREIEEFLKEQE